MVDEIVVADGAGGELRSLWELRATCAHVIESLTGIHSEESQRDWAVICLLET